MTRDEFLGRLGELLACLPTEQMEETKAFYAEAIADRMEDGMSEEEAVAAMGAPGEVAEATLDDLPVVPRAIARTRQRSTALLWVLTIVGSPAWPSATRPTRSRCWAAGSPSSVRLSSWARAPGRHPSRSRASRRSGRGRPPRPSGRARARRAALPRTSRRRKERIP